MASLSANEQLMLELVNRARLDPQAEADRFGIDLNKDLPPGTISPAPKAPLTFNNYLVDSSRAHSQWMIDNDIFSHIETSGTNGFTGVTAGDRMQTAGYVFSGTWIWGENIAWQGTTGTPDMTAYIIAQHEGLFLSHGHRENILNETFREMGIGQVSGVFTSGTDYNSSMVTQNFAKSGTDYFITGVAYTDTDSDNFYTVGEGHANVNISIADSTGAHVVSALSEAAGGHRAAVSDGDYQISFSGGGLPSTVRVDATVAGGNIKIDLAGNSKIAASVDAVLMQNAKDLDLLGMADINGTGNGLDNTIRGNRGNNQLNGGDGRDNLQGGAGNDVLDGGTGEDWMFGGAGDDTYHVDETLDYIDEGVAFPSLPGGGNDTLISTAAWYYESNFTIENLIIDGGAKTNGGVTTIVGGGFDNVITGNSGNNNIYVNWGNDTVTGGAGVDHIDLSDRSGGATGANTVIVIDGCDFDILWNFQSGTDKVDISAHGFADFNALMAVGADDGVGNAFFDLGHGDGDYLIFVGETLASLSAGDFIFV